MVLIQLTLHAHRLIQEFEREARTDGMPSRELADRKRRLVNQFNEYVNLKKQHSSTEAGRGELLAGAGTTAGQEDAEAGGSAADGELGHAGFQDAARPLSQDSWLVPTHPN